MSAARGGDRAAVWIAHLCVGAVLVAHGWALARHAVDVPVGDDWRQLRGGVHLLPDRLDVAWLFRSANRTVYATGKLADWAYFSSTAGSYALYQRLSSAVVLGGCVALTAVLLARLGLPAAWRVLGVLSTVAYLQVQSYWGIAAIAYHQALPVLLLLAVLVLATARRRSVWRAGLVGVATLAAGLAYVSGAVAAFCVGGYLVAANLWLARGGAEGQGDGTAERRDAFVVLAAGAVALALQVGLVDRLALGPERRATPLEPAFWLYAAHLVARAFGVVASGAGSAARDAAIATVALGVVGAAVVRSAVRARAEGGRSPDRTFALVAGAVVVAVASYLVVVAYARAESRGLPAGGDLAAVAKARFHYWWATALVPWVAIAPRFLRAARADPSASRLRRVAAPALVGCALLALQSAPPWSFDAYYRRQAYRGEAGAKCLERGLRRDRPIRCPELTGAAREGDLRKHVEHARARSLPFADALR